MVAFGCFSRLVLYVFVLSLAIVMPSDADLLGNVENIAIGVGEVVIGDVAKPILCTDGETLSSGSACVHLRVEGLEKTIFEDDVLSVGHKVTTVSGGAHLCDYKDNRPEDQRDGVMMGGTPTAALDIASTYLPGRQFEYDAIYDATKFDFHITEIAMEKENATIEGDSWSLILKTAATMFYKYEDALDQFTGCQILLKPGNEVVWAFQGLFKTAVLQINGPARVQVGKQFTLIVTDGLGGGKAEGASFVVVDKFAKPESDQSIVEDAEGAPITTGTDGSALFTIDALGVYYLKAQKTDTLRSRIFRVEVVPFPVPANTPAPAPAPPLAT